MTSINKDLIVRAKEIIFNMKPYSLKELVKIFCPLPIEQILFGIDADRLPVVYNVEDSKSPNIVIWNKMAKQGLKLLKVIAEYTFFYRPQCKPKNGYRVEFVVLTRYAEDWGQLNEYGMGMRGNTSCIGIIPFGSELANTVIRGLSTWINEKHDSSKQPVIVLVDGMENLKNMNNDFQTDFRYILVKGRSKNVYVIGTAQKKDFSNVQEWLYGFQAQMFAGDYDNVFEVVKDRTEFFFYVPTTEII